MESRNFRADLRVILQSSQKKHHSIPTANYPSVISSMSQMHGIHKLLSLQPLHNAQAFEKYAAP